MRPSSMLLGALVVATIATPPIASRAQRALQPVAIAPDDAGRAAITLVSAGEPADVAGEVTDMYMRGDSLEVVYANTGRRATEIIGAVQVRTLADYEAASVPLHAATVKPGSRLVMRVAMPKLAKGKYTLFAVVDYGGAELTAAQAALEIQ